MNKQSGMTLLEVLLAMSIFTAVALTLMSSMQGQRNAIERMRNETLALWIADNQLQSQDSFGEENTSSSGKELINGEEWNWRSDIHSSKDGTLLEHTITVTLPSGQTTSLTRYQSINNKSGRHKMINRQQGFTLLEVMAALAIFSMLSVLAFMIFSQVSELHQRSQKEIQKFNQLQRTITILDNDLLQLVARRNRSTDKIMVLGEEAIFTTQSRDPLALSVKHKPYSLFTGICEIIRSTVLFVLLWMAGRITPPRRCWNMSRAFFWKVTAEKARSFLSQSRYI